MTVDESKKLEKGTRVYWRGDEGGHRNKLGCGHNRLEQWTGGQRAPMETCARNSAGADEAASRDKGSIMTPRPLCPTSK